MQQSFFESWFSQAAQDIRSEQVLEREKYLFWHKGTPLYQPWMAVLPTIITQGVLGSFYSTSVFNKKLDHDMFGHPGVTSRAFVACVACYGMGTLLLGSWIGRHGVFASVRRSLILTPLGWFCFSLAASTGQQWLLYAYGLLHGLGCAHAYISTTSCLTQWYPKSKGLMSGLAVFGAGLGSFTWTLVARALMNPQGSFVYTPQQTMLTLALTFLVLLAVSLPFLRNPPPNYTGGSSSSSSSSASSGSSSDIATTSLTTAGAAATEEQAATALPVEGAGASVTAKADAPTPLPSPHPEKRQNQQQRPQHQPHPSCPSLGPPFSLQPDQPYTFLSTLSTSEMMLTLYLVFATSLPGVVFLSSAADMASNIFALDSAQGSLVTAWLNLSNFTGRFFWGYITDKIGRKSFWLLSALLQACALLAMRGAILQGRESSTTWMACFLGIGSLYGGGFGVLPAFLSDMFGAKISSATHGAAIFFWSLACVVGAPVFAAVNERYGTSAQGYAVNASWLAAFPASALLAGFMLNVRMEDRRAARVTGTWRGRLGPYLCVCGGGNGVGGKTTQHSNPCFPITPCTLLSPEQQEAEYGKLGVRGEGTGEGETVPPFSSAAAAPGPPFSSGGGKGEGRGEEGLLEGNRQARMEWDTRLKAWED
jgi:MFS family permease